MNLEQIKAFDKELIFPTYNRQEVCFVSGRGCKLYDINGKEYTDFLAGVAVNCLGYGDIELTNTVYQQAVKLMHVSNHFYSISQTELLYGLLYGTDFNQGFLCNSGTESIEAAIKLARRYFFTQGIDKTKIVSMYNSFHGRTMGSLALTGQEQMHEFFKPLMGGVQYVAYNDLVNIKEAITDDTCAVILEVMQGEGGMHIVKQEFLDLITELSKEKNVLIIVDEIQTGMGRCGKMFGYQNFNFKPDIITLAKGLGGGMPIGAVLANKKVCEFGFKAGDHGTTFGGNPLACECAKVVVNRLRNSGLIPEACQKGEYLIQKLDSLNFGFMQRARGLGLMVGVPIDPKVKCHDIVKKMLEKGFVINSVKGNTLRFVPPLIISYPEIDAMVITLEEVLREIEKRLPQTIILKSLT
ncbi:MAG: aspartate aminotransferase family protein [Firmicutes bacterium]|nr:aspartate aminotransferase family protein [Bacillota bacterium]